MTASSPASTHFFTVDVEEYFQVNAFELKMGGVDGDLDGGS